MTCLGTGPGPAVVESVGCPDLVRPSLDQQASFEKVAVLSRAHSRGFLATMVSPYSRSHQIHRVLPVASTCPFCAGIRELCFPRRQSCHKYIILYRGSYPNSILALHMFLVFCFFFSVST